MGGSSSHSVSETIKKNQEYISEMNKIKVRDLWIYRNFASIINGQTVLTSFDFITSHVIRRRIHNTNFNLYDAGF